MAVRLRVPIFLLLLLLAPAALAQNAGVRYVSVGQVAQLKVSRDQAHSDSFVQLDEQGDVVARLRAAEGIDLASYVGHDVGLTVKRIGAGDTPLLLVENVTVFGDAPTTLAPIVDGRVNAVAFQEELPPAESVETIVDPLPTVEEDLPVITYDDSIIAEEIVGGTCGIAGCDSCGGGCGRPACVSCAACPCGLGGHMSVRYEYLIWWTEGMDTPALVSTSAPGTSRNDAGVLGNFGTDVVYGDQPMFSDSRSGGRFRVSKWHDRCNWIGFETDFLFLSDEDQDFSGQNVGPTIYGRPFYNVNLDRQDAELIQFPGVLTGTLQINSDTSMWSIGPRWRMNLACEKFLCDPRGRGRVGGYRLDLLLGYRYARLTDQVDIVERLATVDPNNPTYFNMRDTFDTTNDFHGGDIGFIWEGHRGPWSMELVGRVAIGSTRQRVVIDGSTTTTGSGVTVSDPGALLALESNIGEYSRNEYSVLPEMSVSLGYSLSPRSRFLVGYTFMYWSQVVRAGDHIDTNVNTDLIPPPNPTTAPQVPAFAFDDVGYWAQGLSLGFDYRW